MAILPRLSANLGPLFDNIDRIATALERLAKVAEDLTSGAKPSSGVMNCQDKLNDR